MGRRGSGYGEHVGHPHWQLDVLETVRARTPDVPARFETESKPESILEFGAESAQLLDDDFLLGLTIERMHLASAAAWWRQPISPIANTPTDVAELDRWILGCIAYLKQEARRCEIVRLSHKWQPIPA